MKKIIMVTCLQVAFLTMYCQKRSALSIGDSFPIQVKFDITGQNRPSSIEDYKGKIIILDFWNIRCSNCFVKMPELDSLQQVYKDQLKIILVTSNTKVEADKVFGRIAVKRPNLPMIYGDTIFTRLFPHDGDPYHVWLDRIGKVVAFTDGYNTNSHSIAAALRTGHFNLPQRHEIKFDINALLISAANKDLLELSTFHSVLLQGVHNYLKRAGVKMNDDTAKGKIFIESINSNMLMLYTIAYGKDLYGFVVNPMALTNNNRIILEVKDSSRFTGALPEEDIDQWMINNQYSYEILVPPVDHKNIWRYMQEDLHRYLPYTATIERRKQKCLQLVLISLPDKLRTKDSTAIPLMQSKNGYYLFKNVSLKESLLKYLCYYGVGTMPIVDSTDLTEKVDIELHCKLNDLDVLKSELQKYGLDIIETVCDIDVLVIRDRKE